MGFSPWSPKMEPKHWYLRCFCTTQKSKRRKKHRYPQSQQLQSDFLQLKFGSELFWPQNKPPLLVATGGKVLEFFWDVSQLFWRIKWQQRRWRIPIFSGDFDQLISLCVIYYLKGGWRTDATCCELHCLHIGNMTFVETVKFPQNVMVKQGSTDLYPAYFAFSWATWPRKKSTENPDASIGTLKCAI